MESTGTKKVKIKIESANKKLAQQDEGYDPQLSIKAYIEFGMMPDFETRP